MSNSHVFQSHHEFVKRIEPTPMRGFSDEEKDEIDNISFDKFGCNKENFETFNPVKV